MSRIILILMQILNIPKCGGVDRVWQCDKILHACGFFVISAVLGRCWYSNVVYWQLWVLIICSIIGLGVEIFQWKIMGGRISHKDLVADFIGTIGGMLLWI